MPFIEVKNLTFNYEIRNENDELVRVHKALDDISLEIEAGDFVVVLGRNGSGKSTFARCLNGLNIPYAGDVIVDGINTKEEDKLIDIRRRVGMVFQNPDNQIISNVVEEDVAFGPENIGIPTDEMRVRVDDALAEVEMTEFKTKSPNKLSGGQKQRVAIAGVMAMKPECIVLDEPTAMLDPDGRADVMRTIKKLNAEGITIILITHYMEEAAQANRVVVMEKGRISMDGTPREIFARAEEIRAHGLDVPQVAELADRLGMRHGIISIQEFVEEYKKNRQ